jgi:hypothetical protein
MWWRAVIIVPIVSVLAVLITYKLIYSLLTHNYLPFLNMESMLAIKIIAFLNAFLIPYLNWKFYKVPFWICCSFWILTTIFGLLNIPKEIEGNPHLNLVGHFITYHLAAIILTMIPSAISFKKKRVSLTNKETSSN